MSRTFGSLRVSLVFGPAGNSVDPDHATCLRYLAQHDVLDINMARAYGDGEELIGAGLAAVGPSVAGRFTVSTKVHPSTHASGTLSQQSVLAQARESLSLLGIDSVDYFLVHQPDTGGVPLEETLRAADELYRAGIFRRFVRRLAAINARPTPARARPHWTTVRSSRNFCSLVWFVAWRTCREYQISQRMESCRSTTSARSWGMSCPRSTKVRCRCRCDLAIRTH